MYGQPVAVALKHKYTWALEVVWIVFDNGSCGKPLRCLCNSYVVSRQFIVAVAGDNEITHLDQRADLPESVA